jgi:hypothetical protein
LGAVKLNFLAAMVTEYLFAYSHWLHASSEMKPDFSLGLLALSMPVW